MEGCFFLIVLKGLQREGIEEMTVNLGAAAPDSKFFNVKANYLIDPSQFL